MKALMFTALILGTAFIGCSKDKTQEQNSEGISQPQVSQDTSPALPPSDTAALNAPSAGRVDSANSQSNNTSDQK